jgi:hypothetical protein
MNRWQRNLGGEAATTCRVWGRGREERDIKGEVEGKATKIRVRAASISMAEKPRW